MKTSHIRLSTGVIATMLFFTLPNAEAVPSYTVTAMASIANSNATGINSSGQVIGWTDTSTGYKSFILSGGSTTEFSSTGNLFAVGINDAGQVVGYGGANPFFYSGGVLGSLPISGQAYAINNSGQVAGEMNANGTQDAFLYSGGTTTNLGTLGGSYSIALGLNNSGAVVGYSTTPSSGNFHAFVDSGGVMTDLGMLPGATSSLANGINDNGQVIGYSYIGGIASSFVDSNGVMTNLGNLGGTSYTEATGINNNGEIVGTSHTAGNAAQHGFLWADGTMVDINSLLSQPAGWYINVANAINTSGQIAASDCNSATSSCVAVLLTPNAAVPEPGTVSLMGLGLLFFIWSRYTQTRRTSVAK